MKKETIWITWEDQRRNRELSAAFGIKLFEMADIDAIKNPFKKYLTGIIKTYSILFREKPMVVFCQNPSLILSLFLVLFKRLKKMKVCVDAHNAGLFPKEGRSIVLGFISRFIQRNSDLTIVTNEALRQHVKKNGGRPFILQDKIPSIPINNWRKLKGKKNILFICSFSDDEPYEIVFEAARNLDPSICIYVTGNYKKKGIKFSELPDNVILTGFIPESEYVEMLNSVDATIDLTTRENCLVCGAYETLSVEKPMILSKTEALRNYFSMGVAYTENTKERIQKAILEVLERKQELTAQVKQLKSIRQKEWEEKKRNLERIMLGWY